MFTGGTLYIAYLYIVPPQPVQFTEISREFATFSAIKLYLLMKIKKNRQWKLLGISETEFAYSSALQWLLGSVTSLQTWNLTIFQ